MLSSGRGNSPCTRNMATGGGRSHFLVAAITCMVIARYNVSGACLFGTASDCAFQCHCAGGVTCDPDTGVCPGECAQDSPGLFTWSGEACQIGNVARGKSTNQTGTYQEFYSYQAVDGKVIDGTHSVPQYVCAHPDAGVGHAKWTVDLGGDYVIHSVMVFNTDNSGGWDRLAEFDVVVMGGPTGSHTCGRHTGTVPQASTRDAWIGTATISCDAPLVGRYVAIERTGGRQPHLMTVCEVVVTGHKSHSCGECQDCSQVIGCRSCSAPGVKRPQCTEACDVGTYGLNCNESCSGRCVNGGSHNCSPGNGSCPGGCQQWFTATNCGVWISPPRNNDENVTLGSVESSSVEIVWEQNKDLPEGAETHYGYRISYRTGDSGDTVGKDVPHTSGDTWRRETISGLTHNTGYDFEVEQYRTQGDNREYGAALNGPTVKTQCVAPDKPRTVKVTTQAPEMTEGSLGSFTVTWQGPTSSGCDKVTSYVIQYKGQGPLTNHSQSFTTDTTSSGEVTPSSAGRYDVTLLVINNAGLWTISPPTSVEIQAYSRVPTTPTTTTTTAPTGEDNGNERSDPSVPVPIIAGVVAAVIVVLVIVIVVIVILMRRRRKGAKRLKESIVILDRHPMSGGRPGHINHAMVIDEDTLEANGVSPKGAGENVYQNAVPAVDLNKTKVMVQDIERYVKAKRANADFMAAEYRNLPQEDRKRCTRGDTTVNKPKNRFMNISAYDETRVVLDIVNDDPDSDYINANYVKGVEREKEYIATQGPRPHTVYDLWRLVWQENVNRIVMVTKLVENTKRKCDQYWAAGAGSSETYEDITVTTDSTEMYADFTVRVFTVTRDGESRTVRQFNYVSWLDKSRPQNGAYRMLSFRRKVRSFDRESTGPMVVHCSAGVGRTGTFIALDYLINQAQKEGEVDIVQCATSLRNTRMNMIQTKDQYDFVHEALMEAIVCQNTSISSNNLTERYEELCREEDGPSKLDQEFRLLSSFKPMPRLDKLAGLEKANREKNRDNTIIPSDLDRPYLQTRYDKGNNYINAIFTDSFKAHDSFTVTQMPLPNTVVDFWRMIYDHECTSIIMLNELDKSDETSPIYWPEDDEPKQKYGPMEVQFLNNFTDHGNKNIRVRDFRVSLINDKKRKKSASGSGDDDDDGEGSTEGDDDTQRRVRQFQLTSWPKGDELPPNTSDFLELMEMGLKHRRKSNTKIPKVVVHCQDGAARCGIFCTATFMLEKLKSDQDVDVFLGARYQISRRPQFLQSLEQYKFVYDLAVEHVKGFALYANYK